MGKSSCVVPSCRPNNTDARHRFPYPKARLGAFFKWLEAVNNSKLENLDPIVVYKKYRICDKHFLEEDHVTNNRLTITAYPRLHLISNIPLPILDHTYARSLHANRVVPSGTFPAVIHMPNSDHTYVKPLPLENLCSLTSDTGFVTSGNDVPGSSVISPCPLPSTSSYSSVDNSARSTSVRKCGVLRSIGVKKSCELSPRERKIYNQAVYYKKRANVLSKRNANLKIKLATIDKWSKETSFQNLTKHFNHTALKFFKSQVHYFKKKPKGRRFDTEDKIFALALYKQSPAAYKLLSALFVLPSRVTLQKMLSRIPIFAGIHDSVFATLKGLSKNMKHHNKFCVLTFDEMSIEPHLQYNHCLDEVDGLEDFGENTKSAVIANHVQVYMLRGIANNWKQPVGYFFVSGGMKACQIKQNILNIVRKTKEAGLTVVATVCDQGSNNRSAINLLVRETQNRTGSSHFLFEVDDDKIIPLFDVPHLLKTLRNILLYKDIYFTNKDGETRVAKWRYIERTWEMDNCSTDLRALPRLTEHHINKAKIKKMKVSVAAQVFSHSLAATMNLLINSSIMGHQSDSFNEEARGTVEFLKFVDNVFDSLNGSAKKDLKGKPLRTSASTRANSMVHENCWDTALKVFSTMYVVENGEKKIMPCFKNWQVTLSGFKLLRIKLGKSGFTRMKCRRFNQDPLENFFGKIRQRGQRFTKPTSTAFAAFYKSLLVNGLVSKHSVGSNCEDDNSDILISLQRFITQVFI